MLSIMCSATLPPPPTLHHSPPGRPWVTGARCSLWPTARSAGQRRPWWPPPEDPGPEGACGGAWVWVGACGEIIRAHGQHLQKAHGGESGCTWAAYAGTRPAHRGTWGAYGDMLLMPAIPVATHLFRDAGRQALPSLALLQLSCCLGAAEQKGQALTAPLPGPDVLVVLHQRRDILVIDREIRLPDQSASVALSAHKMPV